MKVSNLLAIGGVGLLAYYLLRNQKSPINLSDIKSNASTKAKALNAGLGKNPVVIEDIRVPLKKPIYISPQNVIPDVYSRGIGQPLDVNANGEEGYYNIAGYCSENVQNACRCSVDKSKGYRLDIPKLP